MPLTYNKVIQLSREFSEAHHVLKNFGNGADFDTVLHNKTAAYKYPLMWMEDLSMPLEPGMESMSFRVGFLAQVEQIENREDSLISTNRNEVVSDMMLCAKDFVAYWTQDHTYNDFRIEKSAPRSTVEDVTPDKLTGCYVDITFKQAFTYDKCAIPMSGVTAPPSDCLPVENSMNAVALTDAEPGTTKTFVVTYADLSAVVVSTTSDSPTAFVGTVPNVSAAALNTANPIKTGQDISIRTKDDGDLKRGRLTSFSVLDYNNDFGNTNRFTDILGGQTYADNWVIDWATWNQVTGDFIMWYRLPTSSNWNAAIDAQPYTIGAYADCYMPNINELMKLKDWQVTNGGLNYAPFSVSITSVATRVWASTYRPDASIVAMTIIDTGNIQGTTVTTVCQYMAMRYGNISEL